MEIIHTGIFFNTDGSANIFVILAWMCLLLTLTIFYSLFYFKNKFISPLSKRLIFKVVMLGVVLLFFFPVGSDDLLSYIAISRTFAVHDTNPYTVPYSHMVNDVMFSQLQTAWSNYGAFYGPIFVVIGGILSLIGGSSLNLSVIVFKLFFLCLYLISLVLIFKLTTKKESHYLYLLNPLLVFEILMNAHMELVGIVFFLLGFYLLRKDTIKHNFFGVVLCLLSVLVKYYTLFFIPFVILYFYSKNKTKKHMMLGMFLFAIVGLLESLVLLFMMGGPTIASGHVSEYTKLYSVQASPFVSFLGLILGKLDVYNAIKIGGAIGKTVFFICYIALLGKSIYHKKFTYTWLVKYSTISYGLLLMFFYNWLMPWYVLPFLVLIILFRDKIKNTRLVDILFFSVNFLAIFKYLIFD